MAYSDSNFGRVAFVPEVTFGTTPATPTLQVARITSSDFAAQKETVVSDELRSDRMVSDVIEVAATSGGTLNFELSLGGTFDTILEAALCGTWTTTVNFSGAVTFAQTANTITDDATTGAFTNVSVGQWIYVTDAVDDVNNGWHKVVAKASANVITVATTLAAESADTVTIRGRMLRNGVVKRSFSFEQAFTDIGQYFMFRGQRAGTLSLDVQAGSLVTGTAAFQGASTSVSSSPFGTVYTDATSTPVVNATSNVGAITEAGVPLVTALQAISLNLDNALRNQNAISSKFPTGIGYGRQTVSGSINAYFENAALYTKFLNHTSTSLSFAFSDSMGNQMRFTVPKIFFQSDAPAPSGIDQDVMENLEWTAVRDPVTGCQIQIDYIAAA